mmetsp:Transcript_6620/g.10430  ORF Transcript_6620/g.10430 Transcript_6620/m.10430 type:complete len:86 (-) Transcript_6620:20-277(-)
MPVVPFQPVLIRFPVDFPQLASPRLNSTSNPLNPSSVLAIQHAQYINARANFLPNRAQQSANKSIVLTHLCQMLGSQNAFTQKRL